MKIKTRLHRRIRACSKKLNKTKEKTENRNYKMKPFTRKVFIIHLGKSKPFLGIRCTFGEPFSMSWCLRQEKAVSALQSFTKLSTCRAVWRAEQVIKECLT